MITRQLLSKTYKWRLFLVVTAIWAIFILVVTTLPAKALPGIHFPHIDKIVHFILFMILGFFLSGVIKVKWKFSVLKNWAIVTVLAALIFGIIVEGLQEFVPGRRTDFWDLLFNFIGAVTGVYLFRLLRIIITQ